MNIQDFKSLFNKKYPMTTKARKFWVLVIGIAMPLMVMLIILNLAHSKGGGKQTDETNAANPKVQQVATKQDTDWYKNTTPPLPDFSGKPISKTDMTKLRAMMLGKYIDSDSKNTSDDDTQKAMKAPISANQITGGDQSNLQNNNINNQDSSSTDLQTVPSQNPGSNSSDQNMQSEKQDFLNKNKINKEDYLDASLQNPISNYELQAGTVIRAVLITGINSDLPGQITAQVSDNVYDSISGNNLLVPQGTKVVGAYDSKVAYGQERVLVAWKRLILPNGQSIDLNGMPGVDLSGYAGFNDEVDNHYVKVFWLGCSNEYYGRRCTVKSASEQ
jgi:type IV secretory pathway VirB10-like protein